MAGHRNRRFLGLGFLLAAVTAAGCSSAFSAADGAGIDAGGDASSGTDAGGGASETATPDAHPDADAPSTADVSAVDAPAADSAVADSAVADSAVADAGSDGSSVDVVTMDSAPVDAPTGDAATNDAGGAKDAATDAVADAVADSSPPPDALVCGSLVDCSGACTDLSSDTKHCGSCGHACPAPANGSATCAASTCGIVCNQGFNACGGQCVANGPTACGPSCAVCAAPQTCGGGGQAGVCGCTPSCAGKTCGAGDGCGGRCLDACATCAALAAAAASPLPDGSYTLAFQGDVTKPWTAYCYGMASTPVEYLTLDAAASNYAQYTAGGNATGTSVRTSYTRVRLIPAAAEIDITDRTFSTSTGSLQETASGNNTTVTSMPYGVAASCNNTASGVASIDLSGTPFALTAGQFQSGGWLPKGTATYSANSKMVSLTGGGFCGWEGPGTLTQPVNETGGFVALTYSP